MSNVRTNVGTYKIRGNDTSVAGMIFPLVDGFRFGSNGGFVTVDARNIPGFPDRNIKIRVPNDKAYEVVGDHQIETRKETDEETIERLRERFDMLEDMTRACKKGDVRAMIVSGPPGVGKSHGVEKVLAKHEMLSTLANTAPKYVVVKGAMSPLGLYMKLFNYSAKDNVVVFDDCDSIFQDELSLNILKAALDSKKTRKIFWNTDSRALRSEGIPDQFEFKGSAVFITNLKFEKVKGKLREHLEALESRCHYIDLTIDTDREKMLRIKQIVGDGMLDEYAFEDDTAEEILDFVAINKDRLRELSLRTVRKIADLAKAFPAKWESMS
jgi:predicted AAA+ superfamily ATPase